MAAAIAYEGFALLETRAICPGRYTRRNKLTPAAIEADLAALPPVEDLAARNRRAEYGRAYRQEAASLEPDAEPAWIRPQFAPVEAGRQEIVILGSAGQRAVTSGELLCLAGATAGLHASQKNDYPITVMRGHSISEVILTEGEIGYTGIETPTTVMALAAEGVARRSRLFAGLPAGARVIKAADVALPPCPAKIVEVDFGALKIRSADRSLAALAFLAARREVLSLEMLRAAIQLRFAGAACEQSLALVARVAETGGA
jgi:Pyruvate/2-oxoacid:ferredoxin oxidoreductase gamma subunit